MVDFAIIHWIHRHHGPPGVETCTHCHQNITQMPGGSPLLCVQEDITWMLYLSGAGGLPLCCGTVLPLPYQSLVFVSMRFQY